MKQLLKKVSPFNNSTEMPVSLFIIKKILALITYYGCLIIAGVALLYWKVIVSTILFILLHWWSLFAREMIYSVIGAINLILISVIFSFLTICFKSIWAACGLHSFWNGSIYGIEASITTTIVLVFVISRKRVKEK